MSPYFTVFYFYFFTTLCKNNMFTINDKDTCISCIIIIHLYYFWKTDIHFSRWPCHHPNHPDSTKQCYLSTGACIESRKKTRTAFHSWTKFPAAPTKCFVIQHSFSNSTVILPMYMYTFHTNAVKFRREM